MTVHFFDLPLEIRLNVYSQAFGKGHTFFKNERQDSGRDVNCPSLLPASAKVASCQPRSAQLLRVCKAILNEAQPILYASTVFLSGTQAFAGKLPVVITSGHPTIKHIKHLKWQLQCDLLKRFYPDDVQVSEDDMRSFQTLELRCEIDSWRDSFCGDWCDRAEFVKGRAQIIDFARLLKTRMEGGSRFVMLVEDRSGLSRGRVVLRLSRRRTILTEDVSYRQSLMR